MPDWKQSVRERLRLPALKTEREAEIVEDLAQQLEEAYRQALARGADEPHAQRAAANEISDWNRLAQEITESETRNQRGIEERAMHSIENVTAQKGGVARILADFAADVLHALRLLRKSPGFATVAVLTLALGIGANVALFRVVDALLLQPLPYPEPEQLVQLWLRSIENPENTSIASMPNFIDWRDQSRSFQAMAAFEQFNFNVSGTDEPEQVPGMRVSAAIFDVLGVQPRLGRAFTADEEPPGKDKVVVISDALWRRRFGADPNLVGQTIRINGEPRTLLGVMPPGFQFTSPAYGVWAPIAFNDADQGRGNQSFRVAARIKRGISLAEAQADIDTVGRRLEKQYPRENEGWTVWAQPFSDFAADNARLILSLLLGASGFVLLIACTNIANLFLARGAARRREFAIRLAVGAGRGRIARQLLAESFSLALIGGVAGLIASQWLAALLFHIAPPRLLDLPFRAAQASPPDSAVLLFALGLTLLTAVLFGVLPAWKAARTDPNTPLKESGRGVAGGRSRFHNALVVTEIALVMVVVAGAGLMISSVKRLLGENPGFDPSNVLTLDIALPQPNFYGPPQRTQFCAEVERTVATVPGVGTASAISHLPHTGRNAGRSFVIEGQPVPDENNLPSAAYRLVCPNYFRTLGIPLIAGRDFTHADAIGATEVVIVNEAFVRRYLPGGDPIGKRFKLGSPRSTNPWFTIVGLVGDVKHFGLDDRARREIFRPYSQAAWPSMTIIAKTPSDPATFASAIRKAASQIDRELPISRVQTMQAWVDATAGPRKFPMQLLSAFGAVGLLLAALGIYGVMSYGVLQRTHEIDTRHARPALDRTIDRLDQSVSSHEAFTPQKGWPLMFAGFTRDLLYSLRSLRKSPGFAVAAVPTLALGIGLNTTIFTWLKAIAIESLPGVERPRELVILTSMSRKGDNCCSGVAYLTLRDFKTRSQTMAGILGWELITVNLSADNSETERVRGTIVTENYFDVLGVRAAGGRTFLPEEGQSPLTHPVAVISHGLWQRRFGGDPAIAGKQVRINNHPFTIIGVAPQGFGGAVTGLAFDIFVPTMMQGVVAPGRNLVMNRGAGWLDVVGRLKPGVSIAQARAEMDVIAQQIEKA